MMVVFQPSITETENHWVKLKMYFCLNSKAFMLWTFHLNVFYRFMKLLTFNHHDFRLFTLFYILNMRCGLPIGSHSDESEFNPQSTHVNIFRNKPVLLPGGSTLLKALHSIKLVLFYSLWFPMCPTPQNTSCAWLWRTFLQLSDTHQQRKRFQKSKYLNYVDFSCR